MVAWKACQDLDACEGFVKVLQYILAIGNYLNAGSRQGGAYGFKINTLAKVNTTSKPHPPNFLLYNGFRPAAGVCMASTEVTPCAPSALRGAGQRGSEVNTAALPDPAAPPL